MKEQFEKELLSDCFRSPQASGYRDRQYLRRMNIHVVWIVASECDEYATPIKKIGLLLAKFLGPGTRTDSVVQESAMRRAIY